MNKPMEKSPENLKDSELPQTPPPNYHSLRLSKVETEKLNEIASIILSADDPDKACMELEDLLDGSYQRPLEAMRRVLAGDMSSVKAERLFALLNKLARHGEQPAVNYIDKYALLDIESNRLGGFSKQNWGGMLYFVFMSIIYFIVMAIYKVKVLPVFTDLFDSMGGELPTFTQYVMMDGGLEIMTLVVLLVALVFGCILPFVFKSSLPKLTALPKYLILLPSYLFSVSLYNRYLLLIYARIYVQAGEINPIDKAYEVLQVGRMPKDEWTLLKVASEHHSAESLERQLRKREEKILLQLESRIKATETVVNLILFILFAYVLMIPVIAMYLPIFQMGATV